jgi:hypothetical protein
MEVVFSIVGLLLPFLIYYKELRQPGFVKSFFRVVLMTPITLRFTIKK